MSAVPNEGFTDPLIHSASDEYVVFITPTKLQLSIFQTMLAADKLDNLIRGSTAESLALINMMTKISSSPILLKATADHAKNKADAAGDVTRRHAIQEALDLLPVNARVEDVSLSGKPHRSHYQDKTRYVFTPASRQAYSIGKITEGFTEGDLHIWTLLEMGFSELKLCFRQRKRNVLLSRITLPHSTSSKRIANGQGIHIIVWMGQPSSRYRHMLLCAYGVKRQTPAQKRQGLVNDFNKSSQAQRCTSILRRLDMLD